MQHQDTVFTVEGEPRAPFEKLVHTPKDSIR